MAKSSEVTVEFEDPDNAGTFLQIKGLDKAPDMSKQRSVKDTTGIGNTDEWEFELLESDAPDYELTFNENPADSVRAKLIAAASAAEGTVLSMRHSYIPGVVDVTFKVHFYDASIPGEGRTDVVKRVVRGKVKTIEPVWRP